MFSILGWKKIRFTLFMRFIDKINSDLSIDIIT